MNVLCCHIRLELWTMSVEGDIESMQESREIVVGDRKEQIFLCTTRMSTYHKSKGTVLMLEV